ncbi:hypothetical protein EAS61_27930 [Bradyrhizobium zhanjiangense]|uniref:Uncharacterized protein n=1 Tax=Bradyrhizobium zhanjiangense TaxID=1325107 RepID=A0A4Q0QEI3_9BRAD|nr:hypothetical protein EAS61_27930 [Bradyrhizobium zhanjiangense]
MTRFCAARDTTRRRSSSCGRRGRWGKTESLAPNTVIARSPCDEAIQTVSADALLDCFATLAMTMPYYPDIISRPHSSP